MKPWAYVLTMVLLASASVAQEESVLRASGRAAEAEPLLTQVIEASPGAVAAYMERARVKLALDRAPEALGDASIAAAMAENDPEAQALVLEVKVARALQALRQGNQALAEQDLTQLRGEHPESAGGTGVPRARGGWPDHQVMPAHAPSAGPKR